MEEVIYIYLEEKTIFKFSKTSDKDFKILLSEMEFFRLKEWVTKSEYAHTVKINDNRSIVLYKDKIKYVDIMK